LKLIKPSYRQIAGICLEALFIAALLNALNFLISSFVEKGFEFTAICLFLLFITLFIINKIIFKELDLQIFILSLEAFMVAFLAAKLAYLVLFMRLESSFYATIFLTLFLLFAFIMGFRGSYLTFFKPGKLVLNGIDYEEEKGKISKIVQNLSSKLEVKQPKVFITSSNKINVLSAALNRKEDFILISKRASEFLDDEELESVIAHELWHIKNDVREATQGCVAFHRHLSLLYSQVFSIIYIAIFSEVFILKGFADLVVDLAFFIIAYVVLYVVAVAWDRNATLGNLFSEDREFFADICSSIITEKPRAMISAIRKFILAKFLEAKLASLQFFSPLDKEVKVKSWREVLTKPHHRIVWGLYAHPSLKSRIRILKLTDRLINGKVSLKVSTSPKRFSALRIYWPNFFLLWSVWGRRLRRISEEKIKAVYDYMELNSNNFNLIGCAKALRMEGLDVSTVFFSFLIRGIVDVINPHVKRA
jgi:Zn-dependent protease with chaperone function